MYANAFGTLFAERAMHGDDGLFQTPAELQAQSQYIQEIEFRDSVSHQSYSILVSAKLSNYPSTLEDAFCLSDHSKSCIMDRGWVMQEEILSRRKICFSSTELYWQCTTLLQCDCSIRSMSTVKRGDHDYVSQLLFVRNLDEKMGRGLSKSSSAARRSSTDLSRSWQRLVTLYTARNLTTEADRLPALAGVASRCHSVNSRYLAGLWLCEGVERQLLWRCRASAHRHQFYAPSWSWASVSGAVEFHALQSGGKWIDMWTVEKGSCEPSGYNPFGSVSSGYIEVRGPVIPMRISKVRVRQMEAKNMEIRKLWDHGEYRYMIDDDRKVFSLNVDVDLDSSLVPSTSSSTIVFDATEDLETAVSHVSSKHLFLVAGLSSYRLSDLMEFMGSGEVLGLLVRESRTHQGKWERVCVHELKGFWRDWEALSAEKTVVLV